MWDSTGKKLQTLAGHSDNVMSVALLADGKRALTASDETILWDTATGKRIWESQSSQVGLSSFVTSLAVSGDGKRALSGFFGGDVILWDVSRGKKLWTVDEQENAVRGVALSRDAKRAAVGSGDSTTVLWDLIRRKKLQTFRGHTNPVRSVALSDDGTLVATGSEDYSAILWDAATGKKLQSFQGHTDEVWSVAFSGDGNNVWTGSTDGTIRLWNPATGEERCRLYSFHSSRDWLVVTPEGLFDGSPGAWRFVAYRTPGSLSWSMMMPRAAASIVLAYWRRSGRANWSPGQEEKRVRNSSLQMLIFHMIIRTITNVLRIVEVLAARVGHDSFRTVFVLRPVTGIPAVSEQRTRCEGVLPGREGCKEHADRHWSLRACGGCLGICCIELTVIRHRKDIEPTTRAHPNFNEPAMKVHPTSLTVEADDGQWMTISDNEVSAEVRKQGRFSLPQGASARRLSQERGG